MTIPKITTDLAAGDAEATAKSRVISIVEGLLGANAFAGAAAPANWGGARAALNTAKALAGVVQDDISNNERGSSARAKINALNAARWWMDDAHLLDAVAPSFFLGMKSQKHVLAGKAAALASMLTVSNNSAIRTYIDQSGALVVAAANTPRITYERGYPQGLFEGAATNFAENSGNTGAVVGVIGAGGALPSYTSFVVNAGMTVEITATGETGGVPWTEFRMRGTNSSGATIYPDPGPTNRPTAAVGETWTYSFYAALVAGGWPVDAGAGKVAATEYSAGNIYVGGSTTGEKVSAWKRYSQSRTFNNATTAKARGFISLKIGAGETVDFTFRIGGLQLEKSPSATSLIQTTGTVLTRTSDLCTLHASAGDMTAWAWRGYVPSLIAGQHILGSTGGSYICSGAADPTAILIEGSSNGAPATPAGQLPGAVGLCAGWGASGRRLVNNGGNSASDSVVPDRSRAAMYIGPALGLAAGQSLYLDELVGWVLPDRPSYAGALAQARAAA